MGEQRTWDLFLCINRKVVRISLIWGSRTMPECQPLQHFGRLELVLEPELIVLVEFLEQVQELGAGLHDGERGTLGVVYQDRNATVGVETQEPVLLLLVGEDVSERRCCQSRRLRSRPRC